MIEGGYFGDIEILDRGARLFTVIATEESHFLTLSKQTLEEVIEREYPEVHDEMKDVAKEREKRIKVSK